MFNAFDGIENIIAMLLGFCLILAFCFFVYALSTKTPYDTMISSCESIGYFYINENIHIKCKVIRK
jgi:purine-cytosine permease-like protein